MKNYFILAAIISTVIANPLPDVQSEQQQWGDATTPFLLSTLTSDQSIKSDPQNSAQTGFEQTNSVELSMPFAMDLQQIAVGGGRPSVQSDEVVSPLNLFDDASTKLFSSSTIPSADPSLTQAFSGSLVGDANTGTEPAAGLALGSSSLPPVAASGPELPAAPGSTLDQAPLDINSVFETTKIDDEKS